MTEPDWIYLGSGADCDVRVVGPNVASRHARCRMEPNGRVLIEDLATPGGTSLNQPGSRISINYLNPADTVYLAAQPAPAAKVYEALRRRTYSPQAPPNPTPLVDNAPGVQQLRAERGVVTVIGRDPNTGNKRIVLASPMVSRNHAAVYRTESDEYLIWDLNSTYGTFLDGQRIGSKRTRVGPHQVIGIAGVRFTVGEQGAAALAAPRDGVEIRADGIAVEVGGPWRRRLNVEGVRFAAQPRTMLALMGPSGAGKTTLLRVLGGQSHPKAGGVFYGDMEIYRHFDQVRSSIGFVPQDDVLHPYLTVRQALYFSARLRLPVDYSREEIHRRVSQTMEKLGIAGSADVLIGSVEKRGISGGQRKRVNLAMELLPDPAVLLLDEPTSGLSSGDAERVIHTLRDLAREGRTVIVTIHQPATHIFEMFDALALMDNDTVRISPAPPPQPGRLIYLGPAKTAAAYFQSQDATGASRSMTGADAVFTAIERNPAKRTADWETAYRATPYYREYIQQNFAKPPQPAAAKVARKNLPSPWNQFSTLMGRLWQMKIADRWPLFQMTVLYPLVVALGISLVSGRLQTASSYASLDYVKDFLRIGKTLFFGIFVAIWLGCNNTVREVVGEIAVYRRERMVGLSLTSYLGSKFVFFAGIAAVQCLILTGVCSVVCNLRASLSPLFLLFWLAALCGVSIGLLISALATGGERAIQLVPLALLPMILFGGGVTRLEDMESSAARQFANIVPARWAFEWSLITENEARPIELNLPAPALGGAAPAEPRYTLVHHYFSASPHNNERIWSCAEALLIFIVACWLLAAISLRLQDTH